MEGVPRIPMLSVEPKVCAASVSFRPHLRNYIATHYEDNPDKYENAMEELEKLRERAVTCIGETEGGAESVGRYLGQLALLKKRFPVEILCREEFVWLDKYGEGGSPVRTEELGLEESAVVHNLGAVHSALGARETRLSPDSAKTACTHFQASLSAFLRLKDYPAYSLDLEPTLVQWYGTLMRAQAEECVLEKSMVDGRKAGVVAKVSAHIAGLYKTSARLLDSSDVTDIVGASKAKSWRKFVAMKEAYYEALTAFFKGEEADAGKKYGERLAWFQQAHEKLTLAIKEAPNTTAIKETLTFANDVIQGRMENAKKENDFVYHERVPDQDRLDEVEGVALIKPVPLDLYHPKLVGSDIFAALMPIHVHTKGSLYSEAKDAKLREVKERVGARTEELERFLGSLGSSLAPEPDPQELADLPDQLLAANARLSANGDPTATLQSALGRLRASYADADAALGRVEEEVSAAVARVKDPRTPPPLREELDTLRRGLERFREKATAAQASNAQLESAMAYHTPSLHSLALPLSELLQSLPKLPDSSDGETATLSRLEKKVEEMRSQRDALLSQLQQHLQADDIAAKLLTLPEEADHSDLFRKELGKHDQVVAILDQNLAAQGNILAALVEAVATASARRKVLDEVTAERERVLAGLTAALRLESEAADKAEKGRLFYSKLLQGVADLEDRLAAFQTKLNSALAAPPPPPPPAPDAPRPPSSASPNPPQPLNASAEAKKQSYMDFFRSKSGKGGAGGGGSTLPVQNAPMGMPSSAHIPHQQHREQFMNAPTSIPSGMQPMHAPPALPPQPSPHVPPPAPQAVPYSHQPGVPMPPSGPPTFYPPPHSAPASQQNGMTPAPAYNSRQMGQTVGHFVPPPGQNQQSSVPQQSLPPHSLPSSQIQPMPTVPASTSPQFYQPPPGSAYHYAQTGAVSHPSAVSSAPSVVRPAMIPATSLPAPAVSCYSMTGAGTRPPVPTNALPAASMNPPSMQLQPNQPHHPQGQAFAQQPLPSQPISQSQQHPSQAHYLPSVPTSVPPTHLGQTQPTFQPQRPLPTSFAQPPSQQFVPTAPGRGAPMPGLNPATGSQNNPRAPQPSYYQPIPGAPNPYQPIPGAPNAPQPPRLHSPQPPQPTPLSNAPALVHPQQQFQSPAPAPTKPVNAMDAPIGEAVPAPLQPSALQPQKLHSDLETLSLAPSSPSPAPSTQGPSPPQQPQLPPLPPSAALQPSVPPTETTDTKSEPMTLKPEPMTMPVMPMMEPSRCSEAPPHDPAPPTPVQPESENEEMPRVMGEAKVSLTELADPTKFSLGESGPPKARKADFLQPKAPISAEKDPFAGLDPLRDFRTS